MQKLLLTFAAFGLSAAPAFAQTTPQPAPEQTTEAAKPKTVTKIVCERVEVEATSGSRLSSPPKICKKVEVPASTADAQKTNQSSIPQSQQGH